MNKMSVHLGVIFGKYKSSLENMFQDQMWDVGCDRMVFAINSDLCLIKVNSTFNKSSFGPGSKDQKSINSILIPLFNPWCQ